MRSGQWIFSIISDSEPLMLLTELPGKRRHKRSESAACRFEVMPRHADQCPGESARQDDRLANAGRNAFHRVFRRLRAVVQPVSARRARPSRIQLSPAVAQWLYRTFRTNPPLCSGVSSY